MPKETAAQLEAINAKHIKDMNKRLSEIFRIRKQGFDRIFADMLKGVE